MTKKDARTFSAFSKLYGYILLALAVFGNHPNCVLYGVIGFGMLGVGWICRRSV